MSVNALLRQTAVIYPKSGYDQYGRDQSGSGVSVSCRFQNKTKTKTLKEGQTIEIVGVVYLAGNTIVNIEDRIVFNSLSYKVFVVNGSIDRRGSQALVRCDVTKWQT